MELEFDSQNLMLEPQQQGPRLGPQLEREPEANNELRGLSVSQIQKIAVQTFSELEFRYNNDSNLEEKSAYFMTLLKLRSWIFFLFANILKLPLSHEKYTPDKGNQIIIAQMLKDQDSMELAKQERLKNFLSAF